MKTERTDNKISNAAMYMRVLGPLNDQTKLELIQLLSASMLKAEASADTDSHDLLHCFQGDWGKGIPSKDYCDMLRNEGVNLC